MLRPFEILHHSRRDARSGSRWRILVAALLMAITALVLAPTVSASASESGSIHSFINQARVAGGLAPLTRNAALDQVAANWASQLAASRAAGLEHARAGSKRRSRRERVTVYD